MKKEDYLKNQEIKYKLGVIDRRQFITSAIAAGTASPVAIAEEINWRRSITPSLYFIS